MQLDYNLASSSAIEVDEESPVPKIASAFLVQVTVLVHHCGTNPLVKYLTVCNICSIFIKFFLIGHENRTDSLLDLSPTRDIHPPDLSLSPTATLEFSLLGCDALPLSTTPLSNSGL